MFGRSLLGRVGVMLACGWLLVSFTSCFWLVADNRPARNSQSQAVRRSAAPVQPVEVVVEEPVEEVIEEPVEEVVEFLTYDCTYSYISNDRGYGHYTSGGGCQEGVVSMEIYDHVGTLYEAYDDCMSRGLRLPTYHELSAAGNYAQELGLARGNYWAESVYNPTYNKNCYMPTGNCGSHNPNDRQYYRCVY